MNRFSIVDPIDVHLGERLRFARNLRDFSQGQLGNCVGVSYQQIQKYETGANRISASMLAHVSCHLEIPITYFFQGLPANVLGDGIFKYDSPETHKLISLYYAVKDHRQREAMLTILYALATSQRAKLSVPRRDRGAGE